MHSAKIKCSTSDLRGEAGLETHWSVTLTPDLRAFSLSLTDRDRPREITGFMLELWSLHPVS